MREAEGQSKELRGATKVAKIMLASLEQFPEEERKRRLQAIHAIKIDRRKKPKLSSTGARVRGRRPDVGPRRKRANP